MRDGQLRARASYRRARVKSRDIIGAAGAGAIEGGGRRNRSGPGGGLACRAMERFPEHLRAHFDAPQHVGEPPGGADLRGEARNPVCGDHLVLYLRLAPPADRAASVPSASGTAPRPTAPARAIVAAGFKARGCPVAMATASAACSVLAGLVADASLPAAGTRLFEARFGPPKAAHRHALALVAEALATAVAPSGAGETARD